MGTNPWCDCLRVQTSQGVEREMRANRLLTTFWRVSDRDWACPYLETGSEETQAHSRNTCEEATAALFVEARERQPDQLSPSAPRDARLTGTGTGVAPCPAPRRLHPGRWAERAPRL